MRTALDKVLRSVEKRNVKLITFHTIRTPAAHEIKIILLNRYNSIWLGARDTFRNGGGGSIFKIISISIITYTIKI